MAAKGLMDLVLLPQTDTTGHDDRSGPLPAPIWFGVKQNLMTPVWIDGCFGWLHADASCAGCDVAVLICPPVSWDTLRSHHSLRLLADSCMMAGYPTLRINYPGTGDSRDLAPGEEHWAAWQASITAAADWLRATTGAKRLVLAGLRLGATLATAVGERRSDVDGLLLLAPVLRGRSYMRQLAVEAQMENKQTVNLRDGLDFLELSLSSASVANIAAVDLRRAKLRPGLDVAIFQSVSTRLEDDCSQAWMERGARVVRGGFDGLEAMLLQTVEEDPPPLEPKAVIDWLRTTVPQLSPGQPLTLPPAAPAHLPGCQETAVQFGADAGLSGVLCCPAAGGTKRAVIIVNTGRDPHYGIARFGVQLARRLAAVGIASLRFDFAGLGDSVGPAGGKDVLSALLSTDRSADISAAVDLLEQHGYHEIAVHGLCSGAYHAFHAALSEPRIDTLLLVNFPVFLWQDVRVLVAARPLPRARVAPPPWGRAWGGGCTCRTDAGSRSRSAASSRRSWNGCARW